MTNRTKSKGIYRRLRMRDDEAVSFPIGLSLSRFIILRRAPDKICRKQNSLTSDSHHFIPVFRSDRKTGIACKEKDGVTQSSHVFRWRER